MRKIAQQIGKAFEEGRSFKGKNTETDGEHVWLHGHCILRRLHPTEEGELYEYSLCGYGTVTTRSRLNDLARYLGHNIRFSQWKYVQFVTVKGDAFETDPYGVIPYGAPHKPEPDRARFSRRASQR